MFQISEVGSPGHQLQEHVHNPESLVLRLELPLNAARFWIHFLSLPPPQQALGTILLTFGP